MAALRESGRRATHLAISLSIILFCYPFRAASFGFGKVRLSRRRWRGFPRDKPVSQSSPGVRTSRIPENAFPPDSLPISNSVSTAECCCAPDRIPFEPRLCVPQFLRAKLAARPRPRETTESCRSREPRNTAPAPQPPLLPRR